MRKSFSVTTMLVLIILYGCLATPQGVSNRTKELLPTSNPQITVMSIHDKFAAETDLLVTKGIIVKDNQFLDQGFIIIEPRYYISNNGRYEFKLIYSGHGWVFWDMMTILIDGNPMPIHAEQNPNREVLWSDMVKEEVFFVIPKKVLDKILSQQDTDIRISGRSYFDFRFTRPDLAYLVALREKAQERDPLYSTR